MVAVDNVDVHVSKVDRYICIGNGPCETAISSGDKRLWPELRNRDRWAR